MTNAINTYGISSETKYTGNVKSNKKVQTREDYVNIVKEHIQEMYVKLEKGETEPSYQIGKCSFTIKEWEEFMKKFDSIQDAIQAAIDKEKEEKDKEHKKDMANADFGIGKATRLLSEETLSIVTTQSLVSESTTSVEKNEDSSKKDKLYITWYTEDAIHCREQGQTNGFVWVIKLPDKKKYEDVISFVKQIDSKTCSSFASHKEFWNDFLSGQMDESAFLTYAKQKEAGNTTDVDNTMYASYFLPHE